MTTSQSLAFLMLIYSQPPARPYCRRLRRSGCVARFLGLVLTVAAQPSAAQPASTLDTPGAVIGVYRSGPKTVTASCSGHNGQYTTWDGTVGCRWLSTPSAGLVTTSFSRGLSCLPTPQTTSTSASSPTAASAASVAAISLAQGDSVHLFTSMTTRYMTCGGAGCGTVRIWDYRDGPTPVAGVGGVLVTCLDDLGLTRGTEMPVFYRNGGGVAGNSSGDGAGNGTDTTDGSSPSPQLASTAKISSGAIAGIAIGALLTLILTSTVFLLSVRRRRRHLRLLATAEPKPSEPSEKASFCRRISSRYRPEKTLCKSPPAAATSTAAKAPRTEPLLAPDGTNAPAELDSQTGVPWTLWQQIKSTDVPREMPVDEGCAELLGCETMPCELDATPVAVGLRTTADGKAGPSAADKGKSVATRRGEEHGSGRGSTEKDEAPSHPYNFYSPWSVGEQLAEEDKGHGRQDTAHSEGSPGHSSGEKEG